MSNTLSVYITFMLNHVSLFIERINITIPINFKIILVKKDCCSCSLITLSFPKKVKKKTTTFNYPTSTVVDIQFFISSRLLLPYLPYVLLVSK